MERGIDRNHSKWQPDGVQSNHYQEPDALQGHPAEVKMARTPSVRAQAAARPPFAVRHPWDRPFLLVWVLLIWAAVLIGFVPEIVSHIRTGAPPSR